jgi:L-alanine-DL-glutamate epimerase-like enolase superfamily enzyme
VHTYKGGRADVPIYRALRQYVGPEYELLADPVRSYTLVEAVQIGRLLEELDFVWLEEPLHDESITQLQELCATLTIPLLANETLQNDMEGSCQRLLLKATDLLRASGRYGVTQTMKMAAFAECFGTNIELNGDGGLFGAVSAHLLASIPNTTYFEMSRNGQETAKEFGITNVPVVEGGTFGPTEGPGFGLVVDWDYFRKLTVETY